MSTFEGKYDTIADSAALTSSFLDKDPIPRDDVVRLMRFVREPDRDFLAIVEGIVPESGLYLENYIIELLVEAKISPTQAYEEISRQKLYFERLGWLLPTFLTRYRFDNEQQKLNLIRAIDDCHHDYPLVLRAARKDRRSREIVDELDSALSLLREASKVLDHVRSSIEHHCRELLEADDRVRGRRPENRTEMWRFVSDLGKYSDAIELCSLRANEEPGFLILGDSGTKRHVVESAYVMSNFWNGPTPVTTPGSEFSFVCSLLFEIVSGIADESLSGAINRFLRSAEREKWDRERQHDEQMEDDVDNFVAVKRAAAQAFADYTVYARCTKLATVSDGAHMLARARMVDALTRYERELNRYGPNIVWAHQESAQKREEWAAEFAASESRLKDLKIRMGNLRRGIPERD